MDHSKLKFWDDSLSTFEEARIEAEGDVVYQPCVVWNSRRQMKKKKK